MEPSTLRGITDAVSAVLGEDIKKLSPLSLRAQNKIFKIQTDEALYILKLYSSGSRDEREYELRVLEMLHRQNSGYGFVSAHIPKVLDIDGTPAVVYVYNPGRTVEKADINDGFLTGLARQQAFMHTILKDFTWGHKERFDPLTLDFIDYFKLQAEDCLIEECIQTMQEEAARLDRSHMNTTVIHDDISMDNVMLDQGGNTTIIDFDDAHRSLRISDIGTVLKEYIIDVFGLDERRIALYLSAYNSAAAGQPLTPQEMSALPFMMKRRALFMYAYYNSLPPDAFTSSKIQQQHETLKVLAVYSKNSRPQKPKIGLTIGKFAPLHMGHVDMITFSLKMVDVLYVVVYESPDKTSVPLTQRAAWIRQLFPTERVIVIEGWNAPNRHEDLPEVRRMQEEYLGNVMKGVNLTHFISSEDYGEHLSEYLGTENVVYDKDRKQRNISSTMIRSNYHRHSDMLPPHVRSSVQGDPYINWSTYETVL